LSHLPEGIPEENGLPKRDYNQVANYTYMQSEIDISVGSKSPKEYVAGVNGQCHGGDLQFGPIDSRDALLANFRTNAIPENVFDMELPEYETFLAQRRRLMATKIRAHYFSL